MGKERTAYEKLAAIKGAVANWQKLPTLIKDQWRDWCMDYDADVIAKHPRVACRWFDLNCVVGG